MDSLAPSIMTSPVGDVEVLDQEDLAARLDKRRSQLMSEKLPGMVLAVMPAIEDRPEVSL